MIKLTDEEKDTLSYNDVAYLILKDTNKKIKIQDLFKEVIKAMDLPEYTFEDDIEEFFELIITDNRSHKYYTRGLFAYSLKDELCKEYVSCTDGTICGDTGDFVSNSPLNKGCVTVIKKY